MTYLELMVTDASYNYGLYSNETFDKMIVDAKGLLPGAERDQMMYDAEKLMFSEGGFPVAPIYSYTQLYCKTGDIDNTLVAVFHDLEQAKRCCTRAVMLKDGKIVFDGDIAEAMKTEMLMNIYDFDVASYFNY